VRRRRFVAPPAADRAFAQAPASQLDLILSILTAPSSRLPRSAADPRSPSHALYFATYEAAKVLYAGGAADAAAGPHPLAAAAAGATATVVNDGCMTPWDVVKQRMQVSHSPFRSVPACAAATWRQGGIAAFYRSYWTTVRY
jgi:hypothetical protein